MELNLALVCVGGGRGERFGGDKLAELVGGRPILELSLTALRRAFPEVPLVVVVPAPRLEHWRQKLEGSFPEARFVEGGARRQDSVRAGVECAAEAGAEVAVVHDAARPLVDPQDVKGVVWALGDAAGAVLCSRVTDTVKRIDEHGLVRYTVDRGELRLAQTPQVFRVAALLRGWDEADQEIEWTDEAAMLESMGMPIRSVVAQRSNPKLTTEEDLVLIRALSRGEP
jgi:2-C-methyl-D-erythritol 4-phosphate cytidylyltransferase/2-C-methyl-D-erythritol 2,4-cyclodiphosphate synthase